MKFDEGMPGFVGFSPAQYIPSNLSLHHRDRYPQIACFNELCDCDGSHPLTRSPICVNNKRSKRTQRQIIKFVENREGEEEEVDVVVQQRKDEVCKVLKGTVPINKGYMLVDVRMTPLKELKGIQKKQQWRKSG